MSTVPAGSAPDDRELRRRATAWRDDDPDADTVAAVDAWLAADDRDSLRAAFGAPLRFGTAGLRGRVGPGPGMMNRAVVRRAAAALVGWLDDHDVDGSLVVGRDARHGSAAFAADTVGVGLAAGRTVVDLGVVPTPVLAFAARTLGAAAGVMVTASHNPPADNGYKVYGPDAAQIVSPTDREIAAGMDAIDRVTAVPVAVSADDTATGGAPGRDGAGDLLDRYVDGVLRLRTGVATAPVRVAYTPMHGVGWDTVRRVFRAAGHDEPVVVDAQRDPDPDFPTVAFPNPEEPGAMDLVVALGEATGADLVLANDPDADRLAVAVPDPGVPGAGWRQLTGDEVGVLLADHLLRHGPGGDRYVATTVVSSSMLRSLATAHGVRHVETLTGFKWLARAGETCPGHRPVLAYEEALGYCVGDLVRDKDGISAALVAVEVAGALRAAGSSVPQRLAELALEHGLHRTRQHSTRFEGPGGAVAMAAAVDAIRRSPPRTLAGIEIDEMEDLARGERLPATDAVVLRGRGLRVVVRPSGTEPKLKLYVEVVRPVGAVDDVMRIAAEADALVASVVAAPELGAG